MAKIRIIDGSYLIKGEEVSMAGHVFPLIEGYSVINGKGYIQVDSTEIPGLPDRKIRISVNGPGSFEEVPESMPVAVNSMTDEEKIEELRQKFQDLQDLTKACKRGDIRAMIVSGPPGVGKSFGVEQELSKTDLMHQISGDPKHIKYEVVKGAMSALGLYCKLWKFKDKDKVVVFDDCDSILFDDLSLNILKAALDSNKSRTISWNTDSRKLKEEGIPDSFQFKGSAIFITNIKFDNVRSKKLKDHLEALESRCHYVDLTIDSVRDKMLRIRQVIGDGMLDDYKISDEMKEEIVKFVDDNKDRLREVSLRTVLKVADLVVAFPNSWERMAITTTFLPSHVKKGR